MSKKTKDYSELSAKIVEYVGGANNVATCYHCMTRLRLNIKDLSIVKVEEIEKLNVLGVQFVGEQLQIIIGNEINEVYDAVCKYANFSQHSEIEENLDMNNSEKRFSIKGLFNGIIDALVACVSPIIIILIGSGLIKAILLLCVQSNLITIENPTYITLSFVADSAFYFMPIYVGMNAAKKFGANQALGAMLGAILIHPNFVSMVADGTGGSVFGLPICASSYSSTIVPAILSVWIMSYVEKFISKHSPKSLRVILEPVLTLLIMTPLTLCLLAPVGTMLSDGFSNGLVWLYDLCGPLAVGIFSALVPWVVMTGLHVGTFPFMINSIATIGYDAFMSPSYTLANFAQGAACLGVGIKAKDKELKSVALSCAFSDIIPGISEPGMYAITLKYKTPMYAAMIGSFFGGIYIGLMGCRTFAFATSNIFNLATYISADSGNLMHYVIGILISMIITFIMTLVLYKEKK